LIRRVLLAGVVALATACGGGTGSSATQSAAPPSAKTVAENPSDFPALQKCPESGSYDSYLKQEQSKNPDQYTTDKKTWDDLKAAGANDGYVAVYGASSADCGQFEKSGASGKVANVIAIRFKDSASASASYKTQAAAFHLSDTDIANLQAAGGTVKQGASTGLGDNSIVVSIDIAGTTFYAALWQNKEFEVAELANNVSLADASAASIKINGRIK
jgi:hypothetical protein